MKHQLFVYVDLKKHKNDIGDRGLIIIKIMIKTIILMTNI